MNIWQKPLVKKHGKLVTAEYTPEVARAIQAMMDGAADAFQQRLALTWIVEGACMIHDVSFVPDAPEMSAFNEGRRFVGKQIAELQRMNVTQLVERLRSAGEQPKKRGETA